MYIQEDKLRRPKQKTRRQENRRQGQKTRQQKTSNILQYSIEDTKTYRTEDKYNTILNRHIKDIILRHPCPSPLHPTKKNTQA